MTPDRRRGPVTARRIALEALVAVDEGARANVVVPELLGASPLEPRDRNFVTELVYGTCRMRRACDWLATPFVRGDLDRPVRAAIRLGAYQLAWTRVPAHAAVSATVAEVTGPGRSVVNAVLRRVAERVAAAPVRWPDPATELSYPDWIVERLGRDLGPADARAALETMNLAAAATVRADGYIQDRASQLVVAHLARFAIGRVLDVCAAPGGKATGLAGPGPDGTGAGLAGTGPALVVAADRSVARAGLMASNVARLGAACVVTVAADGTVPPWRPATFDLVLVDAPCSGLGVLRRRPDARWNGTPADVPRLAGGQRRLLDTAVPLVRPGGVLAYSVCTLTRAETTDIDRWLAQTRPGLVPVPAPGRPWTARGRGALLLPQAAGTDGMYLAAWRVP